MRSCPDRRASISRHDGRERCVSTSTIDCSTSIIRSRSASTACSAFSGQVSRSAVTALHNARACGDERLIDAAEITVNVPTTAEAIAAGERAFNELTPKHAEGTLSFWEMYATRALEERVPSLGLDGSEEVLPAAAKAAPEQVAIRVRQVEPAGLLSPAGLKAGDLLLEIGGEPFFRGRGGVAGFASLADSRTARGARAA